MQSKAARFYLYKDLEKVSELPTCIALGGRVLVSPGGDFELPKHLLPGAIFDDIDLEQCDPCWPVKSFPAKISVPSFIKK